MYTCKYIHKCLLMYVYNFVHFQLKYCSYKGWNFYAVLPFSCKKRRPYLSIYQAKTKEWEGSIYLSSQNWNRFVLWYAPLERTICLSTYLTFSTYQSGFYAIVYLSIYFAEENVLQNHTMIPKLFYSLYLIQLINTNLLLCGLSIYVDVSI